MNNKPTLPPRSCCSCRDPGAADPAQSVRRKDPQTGHGAAPVCRLRAPVYERLLERGARGAARLQAHQAQSQGDAGRTVSGCCTICLWVARGRNPHRSHVLKSFLICSIFRVKICKWLEGNLYPAMSARFHWFILNIMIELSLLVCAKQGLVCRSWSPRYECTYRYEHTYRASDREHPSWQKTRQITGSELLTGEL